MRFSFLLALIFTIVLSVGFWYRSTADICPVPLPYRIGEVDDSFDLSFDEVKDRVAIAEDQWESAVNRDLFVYDEAAAFTVNFIFDERQEQSNQEERQRRFLDGQLEENEEIFAAIEYAQSEYDEMSATYESRAVGYEERLEAYNRTVRQYNDRGGAPEEEFAELEAERESLNAEAEALSSLLTELNELGTRINQLTREGNRLVDSYNESVNHYNENFGYAREFTQGDYQGDRINIYEFSSDNELQSVLLHEFGHALGVGHVDTESSVMYYLLEENPDVPLLTASDLDAFYAECGSGKEWDHQLRTFVRNVLSVF